MITIIGRRWFDKINGNTYHSTEVYNNGEFVGREPFTYGYGDHYIQTGREILQDAELFPRTGKMLSSGMDKDTHDFIMAIRDRKEYLTTVSDVGRRKDL